MIDDLEIEIYIIISSNLFGIYSLDIKNNKYLYKQELKISSENKKINFENFDTFLQKNIFKIEKLIGKFIKNISLIVEDKLISNIEFGIKKKPMRNLLKKNL